MLMPKRVKHRKVMRGRMSGMAKGGHTVAFGEYGLATQGPAWITSRQIEAARRAMTRSVKRGGKIWIRVFPDKPATKKPAETRMGSGKGAPDHWVAVVKPGRILFEMAGVDHDSAIEAMRLGCEVLAVDRDRTAPDEIGQLVAEVGPVREHVLEDAELLRVVAEHDHRGARVQLQRLTGLEQDKILGEYRDVMAQIADLLPKGTVLITGHTDNVPIKTLRFPSNYDLSVARAESWIFPGARGT